MRIPSRVTDQCGERGAVAILVGVVSVVLFVVAAFAVDLGKAYVARRDVQVRVDLAALAGAGAGGANLPAPATVGGCWYGPKASAADRAIIDTAGFLSTQRAWDTLVAPADLVDCDLRDGEAAYGRFVASGSTVVLSPKLTQLSVIAPQQHVTMAFGGVAAVRGVDVSAQATVQVRSPKINTLPFYAFSGCDFGAQTIAQPTNGKAADIVLLSHPTESNAASFTTPTAVTPNPATNPYTLPAAVPLNVAAPNDIITIAGSGFGSVTSIGFFESGVISDGPEPVTVPIGSATSASATQISLHLPETVASTQAVWYIRVKIGGVWSRATHTAQGSLILDALPLQVGSPTLTCGQGSSAGNFGTLKLTNTRGPSGQSANIAYNIADGLEHSLTLYPGLLSSIPTLCTTLGLAPLRLIWPNDPTNCVDTKTGLDLDAAQMGFLDGVAGIPGRLQQAEDGGCAADGVPASTSVLRTQSGTPISQAYEINNDTLSCFFTDDSVNVGDIASSSYAGGPVLSPRIYQSSRFALVPVFAVQPTSGGSALYSIVEMRPAFITDQSMTATRTTGLTSTSHNGVTLSDSGQHDIGSLQIVFFNAAALPRPPDGLGTVDYIGSGVKQVLLVD